MTADMSVLHAKYANDQSAERIAERGGFGFLELELLLGHEPFTFKETGARGTGRNAVSR